MQLNDAHNHLKYYISHYTPGKITFNVGSTDKTVILYEDQMLLDLAALSLNDLCEEHITSLVAYAPQLIILGTGPDQSFPPLRIFQPIYAARIGLEIMHTDAACRTYNILAQEGRKVLGLFFL